MVAQDLPRSVKVGEEVLARWSDDGWYYRGMHALSSRIETHYPRPEIVNEVYS